MTSTVDIATFADRHGQGAFVVDVRERWEYVQGHVPRAVLVPMSRITSMLAEIPKDRTVHVICQSGNRSRSMADLLCALRVDAVSVDGGVSAWSAGGRPLVRGSKVA